MAFEYDSFEDPFRSIRLLTIVPDVDEAVVRCMIGDHMFSVNPPHQNCPAYCAVSYTWSPLHPRQAIELNGQHFSVGYNLWLLLKQLRRVGSRDKLWVDALCINQASIDEKNAQVAIMRNIYYSASNIFAWLGEASIDMESSRTDFDAEDGSDAIFQKLNDEEETFISDRAYVERTFGKALSVSTVRLWNALESLCARKYWTRTWILQEISQKPDTVTLLCGTQSVKLNTMRKQIRAAVARLRDCLQHGKMLTSDSHTSYGFALLGVSGEDSETFKYYEDMRVRLLGSASSISTNALISSTREWNELPLLTWFEIASHTSCSDPRDKIYSVVDLADSAHRYRDGAAFNGRVNFIQPNYSQATILLLWEVLAHCCESTNHQVHKALEIGFVQHLTSCLEVSDADIEQLLEIQTAVCPAHLFRGHGGSWECIGGEWKASANTARRRKDIIIATDFSDYLSTGISWHVPQQLMREP